LPPASPRPSQISPAIDKPNNKKTNENQSKQKKFKKNNQTPGKVYIMRKGLKG